MAIFIGVAIDFAGGFPNGHYVWIRACCKLRGQGNSDELQRSALAHIT
jgi:hypothetical protein